MLPSGMASEDSDTLFRDPLRAPGPFRFDEAVVRVFPDMIKRSVPGYETVVAMTGLLAARYVTPGSRAYDLGCSLGASTLAMRQHISARDAAIVAIDNSAAMLERLRAVLAAQTQTRAGCRVEVREENIQASVMERASMVVLNYTLQFIPIEERSALLATIAAAMEPGGVLVLSEKVRFPDPELNTLNTDLHHDFKRAHGYSDLEISAKRDSLETVLVPETLDAHRERVIGAGFRSCDVWFQCFNFASLIALK